nr:immunoglobulin light chain junction region [Macaca mulatta]MOV78983.1 immunoglobulin light chain junction region [Macaca mulatta]MOV80748.1 immunoglobulin light chain junction region [Macaca mulatta]MOV81031.1 immunoglobulin light chain junction region [Macaca mulatta]MOV82036.1 immunoglobulin light chain junction region [Macaca mulatta]
CQQRNGYPYMISF